MDKVTNVAIFLLSKHATLKVKRTALTIEIDETHSVAAVARHDGTTDSHFVSIKSLSSAGTVFINRRSSYVINELVRNFRSLIVNHRGKVGIFAECAVGACKVAGDRIVHWSLLTVHDG